MLSAQDIIAKHRSKMMTLVGSEREENQAIYYQGEISISLSSLPENVTADTRNISNTILESAETVLLIEKAKLINGETLITPKIQDKMSFRGHKYGVIEVVDDGIGGWLIGIKRNI